MSHSNYIMELLVVFLLLSIPISSSETDSESRKVSVSMPSSKIIKDQAPYFATFDATPWATWQWSNGVAGSSEQADDQFIPVFTKQTLRAHSPSQKTQPEIEKHHVNGESPLKKFQDSDVVHEVTPKNVPGFLNKRLPFVMFLLCECERDALVADHLEEFGNLLKDKDHSYLRTTLSIMYASIAATTRFQLKMLFQLSDDDLPALVIDNIPVGSNVEKHRYEPLMNEENHDEVSAAGFMKFLDDFLNHRLPLLIRSAARPIDDHSSTPGEVVDVVSSSFDELVNDKEKDVLLLVYSPRCGGSNAVQPVFKRVASHYKDDPSVRICRMDGTRNDFPHHGIRINHYPTAFLFPRGRKVDQHDGMKYLNWDDFNGSKTPHNKGIAHSHYEFDSIIEFIEHHRLDQIE